MRIGVVLVGFCAIVCSIYFVTWLLYEPPKSKQQIMADQVAETRPADDDLTPSREGPHPKVVIDQTDFEFGSMEVGEEKSHEFTIRNEGEAPLRIKQGRTDCKCTISDLDTKTVKEIAPGDSVTVNLTWKPEAESDEFVKSAEVLTNDPQQREVMLRIQGRVLVNLTVQPQGDWHFPEVRETDETEIQGIIGSPLLESFNVLETVCADRAVTVESEPLSQAEAQQARVLSGHLIRVKLQPVLPVGVFRIPLTIKTDVPHKGGNGNAELTVYLSGNRRGPLRIMGRGNEWVEEHSSVVLGSFAAQEGKKVRLLMIVPQDPPGGLQFSDIECNPPELQVALAPDDSYKGSGGKRYNVTFEYPPKSPRAIRNEFNPGQIQLRTNHPQAPTFQLSVYFNAH